VSSAVLQAIEPYLDALADRIAERMNRSRERMINQHDSELGPRRHRDAVKRRLANAEGGAGHAGRNYLLTKEAIREELAGRGGRGSAGKGAPSPANDGSPGSGGSGAKSRSRDLSDFEREVMTGLRTVKP
jgi:predicted transcriptional regulator